MTTTGTYTYNPILADIFDEAVEDSGIDPSATGGAHIKAMLRTLKTMVNSEWATIGFRQWMIAEAATHTVSVGEVTFTLPVGGIDIVNAVLRRQAGQATPADVEMYVITRQEYAVLTNKNIQGRPDRYFVDRQSAAKTVYYWQAGSNTTDQIVFDYFHQMQDVGNLSQNLDLPVHAYAACVAGLAARLALKWNAAKYDMLMQRYIGGPPYDWINPGGLLGAMRTEDRERGDIDLYPAFEPRTGRR